ncbi:response regulator transcription factor [Luteococcus peritonei]|uniref:Response regulator transcription factor n=1 Tax=Luteococcus peritonei TaxID=88874 RepID=A0ABW4RX88_9ACTN
MARVAVVVASDTPELPACFDLLTHVLQTLSPGQAESGGIEADLVLVDARRELARARDLCLRLQAADEPVPVMLLVEASSLPLIAPEWGAADFVLDSAQPAEIDARIRLLTAERSSSAVVTCGPVSIDEQAYSVTVGGHPLELTYTEFELLKYLVLHPGRVLTREHLLSEVWGYDYYGGTRTVDVHIRRLRAKLGAEYDGHIGTVRNVGYRFVAQR